MATLTQIKKQIADLEEKAAAIRRQATAAVALKVKALIARHALTAEDLGFGAQGGKTPATKKKTRRAKAATSAQVGVPKYRDAQTGKTWTGTGKPPAWIAGQPDRSAFLINAAVPASAAPIVPAPAAAKKTAKKPAPSVKVAAGKPARKKVAAPKVTAEASQPVQKSTRVPKAKKPAAKEVAPAAAIKAAASLPNETPNP